MSLDDALERLLAAAAQMLTGTEAVATADALGRVLAQDVISALDVPPQDNTSMDGYAVRTADVTSNGAVLPVSQRIPAGLAPQPLTAGTAARIFTGGQVPAGADAIVMQEQVQVLADGQVRFETVPSSGQWIRRRGEDIAHGSIVLRRGERLGPQGMGLAASVGLASVQVVRRPRVALFSTGDELVMPGEPLRPGAIYNSNRFTLMGLLRAAGCEVTDLGIVPDQLQATRQALRQAAQGHDLIITSGGVSVGEEDHLRPALLAEGRLELWQIAMKPGKPLAFGAVRRGDGAEEALYVGLPGNPVSSWVTCLLAVMPVLRALQGMPVRPWTSIAMRADFDWPRPDKRREFLRVRFNAAGGLDLFANQSSGVLTSAHWADALVDNPSGQVIARGDTVQVLPLSWLMGS
jgi:molybdopterin molybdotransferase